MTFSEELQPGSKKLIKIIPLVIIPYFVFNMLSVFFPVVT